MKRMTTTLIALAAAGFASLASAAAAPAAVERAKSECLIGERNDGYLGVVSGKSIDEALQREIRSINQRRKAAYEQIAARNGVTVNDTARLTAEKLINGARRGECVQNAAGAWIRK
ncbi:MAG: YdbL family protein [Pseudomonadota bacterium]